MERKVCTMCKEEKAAEDFSVNLRYNSGLSSRCKACSVAATMQWRTKDPERYRRLRAESKAKREAGILTNQQRWNGKNKERLREYYKTYQKQQRDAWRANNPERLKASNRRNTLLKRGLTPESYAAILEAQNGVCAICEGVNSDGRPLGVDHDHGCHGAGNFSCSSCNRGLLCVNCNATLHKMENNVGWHLKALAYLDRYKENTDGAGIAERRCKEQ